jgi:phage tail sheath protein FI
MAGQYKTPGVYIEEISLFPPSVAQVETAIPAFIGHTEKASKDGKNVTLEPIRLTSLLEYREFFGGPQKETNLVVKVDQTTDGKGNVIKEIVTAEFGTDGASLHTMYYAMQAYFANGGGPCYVVSVGGYGPLGTEIKYDDLKLGLDAIRKEDEVTLINFPEAQGLPTPPDPNTNRPTPNDQGTLYNDALAQCEELKDRFVIMDLHKTASGLKNSGDIMNATNDFRDKVTLSLKYGAAYYPNLKVIFNYFYDDDLGAVTVNHLVDGNAVEPPDGFDKEKLSSLPGPLIAKGQAAINNLPIEIPPSPAIAGIYARVDNSRGVWKAPANEGINAVQELPVKITNDVQDFLNVDDNGKSINAIRAFVGKGTLVWGARTLDGNSNEWRYVSVRRFFNMVEESTKKATERFVFEPNDANTWVKVRAMIENFLIQMWNAGALQGSTPEQAFFVKVGLGETMTALDILEGRMIVEIGMAVVRPAEFIILRFSHKMPEA